MKALVYTGPKAVRYCEQDDPMPQPGEVLVRVDAVGICGSDMHAYLGHDPRRVPPLILGHEAVGEVVAGPGTGRRAVLNPLITCGLCDDCQGGRSNLCRERKLIGMNRPGAFADLIAIPEANLIPIPADMRAARAALTEPAATALHAIALAGRVAHRPVAEARALVLGGGSVGLLAALLLRDQGCGELWLGDINRLRRDTAANAGPFHVFDPTHELPTNDGFDLVIDAVGAPATRATAVKAVRAGGVIMHIGLADSSGEMDVRRMTLAEVTFVGTYTYTPVDLRAAVNKLYSSALGDLAWIEQRALADGANAFADLLNGQSAAAKIILKP